MDISVLVGKTLLKIEGGKDDDNLEFICTDGSHYRMYHYQDCCEHVRVDDIVGDFKDLIGWPILSAEETSNSDNPPPYADSFTWTFYHFRTFMGTVTIKWLGESNGYYSESVDFAEVKGRAIENIHDVDCEIVENKKLPPSK